MKTKILFTSMSILLCFNLTYAQPGMLDISFNPGTGADKAVYTSSIQNDGKIIYGGEFFVFSGVLRKFITRINIDGSFDTTFVLGSGLDKRVIITTIQSDGKILIGGEFTNYNGTARNRIVRLNTNGSLDTTFDPGTGVAGSISNVHAISIQIDGRIIVGGDFTSFNGTARNNIVRLNTDGSLDTTFDPGTGANDWVSSINIQSDGKFIVGGKFTSFNEIARNRIVRLNSDGSLDNSFDPGEGANATVMSSSIQNDGKIIIGGLFNSFNGTTRYRIARLNIDGSLDNTFG